MGNATKREDARKESERKRRRERRDGRECRERERERNIESDRSVRERSAENTAGRKRAEKTTGIEARLGDERAASLRGEGRKTVSRTRTPLQWRQARSWPALIRHLMLEGGVPGPRGSGRVPLSLSLSPRRTRDPGYLVRPGSVSLSFLSSPRRLGHHRQKDRYCF